MAKTDEISGPMKEYPQSLFSCFAGSKHHASIDSIQLGIILHEELCHKGRIKFSNAIFMSF